MKDGRRRGSEERVRGVGIVSLALWEAFVNEGGKKTSHEILSRLELLRNRAKKPDEERERMRRVESSVSSNISVVIRRPIVPQAHGSWKELEKHI